MTLTSRKIHYSKQKIIIEENKPFSESIIWQWQKEFFTQNKSKAWQDAIVPHYVTSNTFIAQRYAKIILNYLHDIQKLKKLTGPVYIIELGAGCGKFAFHFIHQFFDLLSKSSLENLLVKYIITDFVLSNLDFPRNHPALQSYIAAGQCDFAVYNAESNEKNTLQLLHSNHSIDPQSTSTPLILIANYVFDGLKQDLFYYKKNKTYEVKTTVKMTAQEYKDKDPNNLISVANLSYKPFPLQDHYYQNSTWNHLISSYQTQIEDNYVLIPISALKCLDHWIQFSHSNLLFLTADKGFHDLEELKSQAEPSFTKHGSFSLNVNYHCIAEYVRCRNGLILQSKHQQDALVFNVFLFNQQQHDESFLATQESFAENIEDFGPNDFFHFKKHLETHVNTYTLAELYAHLRLSAYDSKILWHMLDRLHQELPYADTAIKHQWREIINRCWSTYYPLNDAFDMAYDLAYLMAEMEYWQEAITYYEYAIGFELDTAMTRFNLGYCYWQLGSKEPALLWLNKALALEQNFTAALELIQLINTDI